MSKIEINKSDYEHDLEMFFTGFQALLSACFGEEQVPQFETLESIFDTQKTKLEIMLDALPEFVLEGKWDFKNGDFYDLEVALGGCDALLETPNPCIGWPLTGELHLIIKAALARVKIYDADSANDAYPQKLTMEDLALLAGMSVASVKNAQYAKNDDRLIVSEDGSVTTEVARRWLQGRRLFKPTYFYNSKFVTLKQLKELKTITEVRDMLQWGGQEKRVTAKQIVDAFDGAISVDVAEQEFCREYRIARFEHPKNPLDLADFAKILTPSACINLAKLLDINPSWFAETATKLAAEYLAERLVQDAVFGTYWALQERGLSTPTFAPEEIATADAVRQLLTATQGMSKHPKFKKGNKKIEVYLLDNGRSIAHEYNLRKQALWARQEGLGKELHEIDRKPAPVLHSGLKKYSDLTQGQLIKFLPRSMGEVKQIVEAILSAEPISHDNGEVAR